MTEAGQGRGPRLAVIDYGMGNLRSVVRAWEHVGAAPEIVTSPDQLTGADALVFPGQGAIIDTMVLLNETGFADAIRDWVAADKPYFGICLGLQALFAHSEEGDTPCLGILEGEVRRFRLPKGLKIPHMGWNAVHFHPPGAALQGPLADGDQFYFVHSYYADPADRSVVWTETDYGGRFVSGVARGRLYATQFHPEKSQAKGLQLYRNFVASL